MSGTGTGTRPTPSPRPAQCPGGVLGGTGGVGDTGMQGWGDARSRGTWGFGERWVPRIQGRGDLGTLGMPRIQEHRDLGCQQYRDAGIWGRDNAEDTEMWGFGDSGGARSTGTPGFGDNGGVRNKGTWGFGDPWGHGDVGDAGNTRARGTPGMWEMLGETGDTGDAGSAGEPWGHGDTQGCPPQGVVEGQSAPVMGRGNKGGQG